MKRRSSIESWRMVKFRESSLDVGRKIQSCKKKYEIYVTYIRYGNLHLRLHKTYR